VILGWHIRWTIANNVVARTTKDIIKLCEVLLWWYSVDERGWHRTRGGTYYTAAVLEGFKQKKQKTNDKTQLSATTPPLGVCNLVFFLWFLAKKPKQKMTRPNSLPLLPPLGCAIFFFLFFIFFGFLFPGSLLVFLSLDLTLCQFSHFRGCQLAFGWFYYLLWACGFIRKLCKKNWQNAGITGGSLRGLGHKLGHFVCLCNLSKTVWNKCKNIGSQWMCRTEFDIDILGSNPWIRTCSNTLKDSLEKEWCIFWSECFLQQVHFFYN